MFFNKTKRPIQTGISSLIRDFSWLWAIRHEFHPGDAEMIKVSQDMNDLKTILMQKCFNDPRFELWAVTRNTVGGTWVTSLKGDEKVAWAEVIMDITHIAFSIDYLAAVYRGDFAIKQITIFRHPEKCPLNKTIEQACRLTGSSVKWHVMFTDF